MQKLRNTNFEDGFTTELAKTQEQILNYVNDMQPVCQKLIKMNSSKSKSTVGKHLRELEKKDMVNIEGTKNKSSTVNLAEKGQRYLQ